MKKILALTLSALMLLSLVGCGAPKDTPAEEKEAASTTVDTTDSTEEAPLALDFFPLEFTFSSGAGGWATILTVDADRNVNGEFFDSNFGESDDTLYPNGTIYVSNFSGKLEVSEQINEYSYKAAFENIETEKTVGEEWIEEGTRYVGSESYGVSDSEYVLYTPTTPVSVLSEDFLTWTMLLGFLEGKEVLGCYALYNETEGVAFFTY